MDAHTPTPSDEGAEGLAMTIGLRRWTILLAAASLLLGSCSASPTTYAERDAADEEARETEDAKQPAPTTAPAEEPMDGTGWILFQAVFDNEVDLGLVRPDGTQLHRLPRGPGNRWHPDWSPDGTRIVYDHGLPDARAEIRTVGVDGSDDRLVDGCEKPCLGQAGPAWSPDGRSIAFDGYEGPTDGLEHERCYLAIYDLDTNEVRRTSSGPAAIRTRTPTSVRSPRGPTCVSAPTVNGSSSRVRGRGASGRSSPRPSRGGRHPAHGLERRRAARLVT
jgi:hypothetical protein